MDFPFTALVGQEQLRTALLLNAVYPAIGGVLIRGEKGTAKSTAARALATLLPHLQLVKGCPFHCDPAAPWGDCPHCQAVKELHAIEIPAPFVDLPLGATEDRVLGTLDFEKALREGCRAFEPGLLAAAHRGILYIDEVNLLPNHLVDVLLDAAAMGINTVQREGVSVTHPARFLLIGTMNPEEGTLRPQLLDRFGLVVDVTGPRDPAVRAEIVRRRLAYESDPVEFARSWAGEQSALRQRVADARAGLSRVVLADDLLTLISQLCCESEVDGLRADLALHKTARARAAYEGRAEVLLEDVRAAAALVLPHRARAGSVSDDYPSRKRQRRFCESEAPATAQSDTVSDAPNSPKEATERLFDPLLPTTIRRIEIASNSAAGLQTGRRNPAPAGERGPFVRAVPNDSAKDLALGATVRAAARRGSWVDGRLHVTPEDLHCKERAGRMGTLLLFVVDASGSMAARQRMELVKGTVLGLLQSAYEQRDEVAVIAFRGPQAEVLLEPTSLVERAEQALRILPTGGRTPLAHALALSGAIVRRSRQVHPKQPILLVLLSDGRANVALPGTTDDPWQQALREAADLAASGVPALVLDTDAGFVRLGRVQELSQALATQYLRLEDLSAERLVLSIRQRS